MKVKTIESNDCMCEFGFSTNDAHATSHPSFKHSDRRHIRSTAAFEHAFVIVVSYLEQIYVYLQVSLFQSNRKREPQGEIQWRSIRMSAMKKVKRALSVPNSNRGGEDDDVAPLVQ